jgi:hypothetical protein
MARRLREIIIPKEEVSFWLDRNGLWHNENERFQNQKVINYFHSCIKKDARGFHLAQRHRDHLEKAYFPFEDTALFVFDVIKGARTMLVLNTQKRIKLKPKRLFTRGDTLYMLFGEDPIKFTENSLVKIAEMLEFHEDESFIRVEGRRYRIEER